MKSSYYFSILTAALILVFFVGLPELKTCPLPPVPARGRRPDRREALGVALLTLAYAVVAFTGLGRAAAPKTYRSFDEGESVTLELSEPLPVGALRLYTGIGVGEYSFELSSDGEAWQSAVSFEQNYASLLKWHDVELSSPEEDVRYLRVTGRGGCELGELALIGIYGDELLPFAGESALTDEQSLVPAEIDYLNSSYFDEIYHARTAWEHLRGINPYEISHPPLGKLILSVGILLFGMNPFGWRFMGTLFGVLMLPLLWAFARRLFGGRTVPLCCAALMAADFMHFVQTRIATIDTYGVFFILLMYGFMFLWLETDEKRHLALSGLFFGLGAASKWICLYAGAGLGLVWLCRWVGRIVRAEDRRTEFWRFAENVGFCLIFFVALPAAIYSLSYLPYAAPKGVRPLSGAYFKMVWDNQVYMFTYHAGVNATHPYSSRWYQWMLDIRPILYYLNYFPDGTRSSFGAWVNPVICWAGLLAEFVLLYMAIFRRDRKAAFLLLGYLSQLVPWMFIGRVTFEYHYFPSAVFLILALGYVFSLMREAKGKGWRVRVIGLTLLSAALFVLFYPALTGVVVDNASASKLLKWLPTWPFVGLLP